MCSTEKHDIFFRHENTDFLSEHRLTVLGGTDVKHDIMCHDVATLKNCKTIAPRCQTKPRCYENPWIRYFDQISARPNRAPYPREHTENTTYVLARLTVKTASSKPTETSVKSLLLSTLSNIPCHGFRPRFCWVVKEIKERLPSPRCAVRCAGFVHNCPDFHRIKLIIHQATRKNT